MSQESGYSQTSNSQNDSGHQSLEEIKNRSEKIIKQKCKDDFKLTNLQKDHQDFQKLIEEINQQISDSEKDNHYLSNTLDQIDITRRSVITDVEMIVKSVAEYFKIFADLKASIQYVKSDFNKNKDVLEVISKNIKNCFKNDKIQEKQQALVYKRKLLKDLKDSLVKLTNEKSILLENREIKLLNLEKEEQDLLVEFNALQNKVDELKKQFDLNSKLKDDLENDLKIKQENYDADLQKFETEKSNTNRRIEEIQSTYNDQREKICDLEKKLEELGAERKTQNSSIEEIKLEANSLEKCLTEQENMVENQKEEVFKCNKLIEELRSESSKIIDEDEKLLKNLEEELYKLNTSIDQIQFNIINDTKILDDLKHEEDLKKDEINSLQNNLQDITKTIEENEIKYEEIINGYTIEINEIQVQKHNLLDRKEKCVTEKDNISQMISDLELKKLKCVNESAQIESKQNVSMNNINEEIANLRNTHGILEKDLEKMENNYEIQYAENLLQFKVRKNEILENTNKYKERMEIMEREAEEAFKVEKNQYLDDQTKMELQISEYNAAIDNLQEELKSIVKQINSEHDTKIVKPERVSIKIHNILKQNGPTQSKSPEIENKKEETVAADQVFEWTTDEEVYKLPKSQKMKTTQLRGAEKSAAKLRNIKKKVDTPQKKTNTPKTKISKLLIEKISSTDSDLEWIQPSKKAFKKK